MNIEQKQKLTEALNTALERESQNKIAEKSGVNHRYLGAIKEGKYSIMVGDTETAIADKHIYKLADALGIKLQTEVHFDFEQFDLIQRRCAFAQSLKRRVMITSMDSGCDKTYGLESYSHTHNNVVYVKITSLMTGKDLMQKLMEKLHIQVEGRVSNVKKLDMIADKMIGANYLLILDEMEKAKTPIHRVIKDIEDATYREIGFILCGIDLDKEFKALSDKGKALMPQLWRRFRTNITKIKPLTQPQIVTALKKYGIVETAVVDDLKSKMTDMSMLNEYVRDIIDYIINKGHEVTLDSLKKYDVLKQF